MPVQLDVHAQLAPDSAGAIAEAVKKAVRDALNEILSMMTLSDDERAHLAEYRELKADFYVRQAAITNALEGNA